MSVPNIEAREAPSPDQRCRTSVYLARRPILCASKGRGLCFASPIYACSSSRGASCFGGLDSR